MLSLLFLSETATAAPIQVMVSIMPQLEFVQAVGKHHVHCDFVLPPGASPDVFEWPPSTIQKLHQSQVYFMIGLLPFEKQYMKKIHTLNPDLRIVDSSEGLEKRMFSDESGHSHVHSEHNVDPHIWLSPKKTIEIVEKIAAVLSEIDPSHHAFYHENKAAYIQKLKAVDRDLRQRLSHVKSRVFIVFHPAYGYFADEYGLEQRAIQFQGKTPTAKTLQSVIRHAKANKIDKILVQNQSHAVLATYIAKSIDGEVILIDPLSRDYMNMLNQMGELLTRK